MMLSRTTQYALQALTYMAVQPRDRSVLNREIAANLDVPSAYLAKILQDLSKAHLLESTRGRSGGFRLGEGVEKTPLMDIVLLMEGERVTRECILGRKECGGRGACPMHSQWKPVKKELIHFLRRQRLRDLAKAVRTGEYRLRDIPLP
jgi:Rrf2 family protein